MTANEELIRELSKVISDPGSVLPRHYYRPGERETEAQWAARAVLASLPSLPGATVVPSPAEEAVKRVEALHTAGAHGMCAGCGWTFPCPTVAALASPAPAPHAEIPYMMANTPEEFERVRRIPWLEKVTPDSCGHTDREGCTGHGDL